MVKASEADFGFLLEIVFFFLLNLLDLSWAVWGVLTGVYPFWYPDVVILDAKQLMGLFLKRKSISEDSLLHLWYEWNASFAPLIDAIIFPWAVI